MAQTQNVVASQPYVALFVPAAYVDDSAWTVSSIVAVTTFQKRTSAARRLRGAATIPPRVWPNRHRGLSCIMQARA